MKRKIYGRLKGKGKSFGWVYFLAPSLAGVLLFVLLPFADVVRRSFLSAVTEEFRGMENYRMIFSNSAFILSVKNTLKFTVVCIPMLVLLGLAIALPLSKRKGAQLIKSLYLFPLAMPTAAIVIVWKMVFYKQGFLNKLLTWLAAWHADRSGKEGELVMIDFLGTGTAFFVLAGTYLWKNLGYTIVLWLSGIMSISGDILEAARVDGAGKRQSLFYVLLPNLRGSLYTIVVLSFLNSFKIYREAYLTAGAYPHESIYLLQHLFNNWFVNLELDKMAAAAVVVGCGVVIAIWILQRLWDKV